MRIAAFQRRPIFDDPGRSVDTIVRDVALASARDIDLALFPESYLQGHSYDRFRIEQRALSLDDPIVQALAERLSGARPATVVGLFERRGSDIHNSAVVIAGGRVAGVYAKAFPIEDGCAPGDLFPVWRRHGWTFGINICNDLNFPEATKRLTDQGAALISGESHLNFWGFVRTTNRF